MRVTAALLLITCFVLWSVTVHAMQHASPGKSPISSESDIPPKKPAPATVTRPRGELLYENHCLGCHTSRAHLRENRRAKSVSDVEGWVQRWVGELKLGWNDEDVSDVTQYLVKRYYKFAPASSR